MLLNKETKLNQSTTLRFQLHKSLVGSGPWQGGCSPGVMVKAMDCGIVVSEFVLQSRYYVHFRANTLILPAVRLNSTTTVLLGEWL